MLHLLQGKVSVEEFRTAIQFKVDINDMQNEIRALRNSIEEVKIQMCNANQQFVTQKEVHAIQLSLDSKADITEINAALNEKATKISVANALHKKANKADVEELLADKASLAALNGLITALDSKVGVASFNMLASEVDKKADKINTEKLVSYEISRKADQSEVENIYEMISSLKKEFEIKMQQQSILFGNYISDIRSESEMTKFSIYSSLDKKADFRDFEKISENILRKSDTEEVNYLLNNLKSEYQTLININQDELKEDFKKLESFFQEQISFLDKRCKNFENEQNFIRDSLKINSEKFKKELDECFMFIERSKNEETRSLRFDIEKIQREFEDVKSKRVDESKYTSDCNKLETLKEEFKLKNEQLNLKFKELAESANELAIRNEREVANISGAIKSKFEDLNQMQNFMEELKGDTVKRQDWESHVYKLQEELDKLGKEILLKANIKDICTLLDIKANIDDVNHALEELHQELDTKINVDELTEKLREQSCINEALCAENCVGRWLWKSGEIKTASIPWEVQSINTCPENYIWEKDKTIILALTPGLYHIQYGVFSKKKCSLQLLVNGEIIISDANSQGKVFGKHSSGNIVGYTYSDFLSLPSRARISIAYTGDSSEGFIGLKKL